MGGGCQTPDSNSEMHCFYGRCLLSHKICFYLSPPPACALPLVSPPEASDKPGLSYVQSVYVHTKGVLSLTLTLAHGQASGRYIPLVCMQHATCYVPLLVDQVVRTVRFTAAMVYVYLFLVDGNLQLLVDGNLEPDAARAAAGSAAPLKLTDRGRGRVSVNTDARNAQERHKVRRRN